MAQHRALRNLKAKLNRQKLGWALLVLFALVPLLAQQSSQSPEKPALKLDQSQVPPPSAYAGQAACAQCHAKQAGTYAKTVHALDTSLPSEETVLGDFSPKGGVLRTKNPKLAFVMTRSADGFFQSAVDLSDPQNLTSETRRIDIVVGSGRHGQTYLNWQGDKLYELPVSYWTYANRWVNSPGYPDGELHWNRAVGPRCLECHASYFNWLPTAANRYNPGSLVLGIDCERCHGPGALHVARERSASPPAAGSPELAIVNPAHLSRDQQMSLCSLCHAGAGPPIRTPMTFKVGDDIHDFLKILPPPADAPVDVHGNQVGALQQSKCYGSGKLNCSTCHNVHQVQENAVEFSGKCLTCHQVKSCGEYRTLHDAIRGKCVTCHMPVGKSNVISTRNAGDAMQATMRSHRIAIYPGVHLNDDDPAASGQNK